jgi:ribosomal protein L25 (general stress protein Ctc)
LRYEIYVEADGYGEDTEALKLNPANREPFTVVLKKATTTIKGVVIDSDKQPVAGIPVALDTGNFIHLRTTDSTGHFDFPVVEKQLWKIMVRNDRGNSFSIAAQHFDEKEIESRFAQGDREPVEFEVPKLAR